jgi:LacI family repressor for deo operon, udp, cdd, tsx, nupC, and nupG
MTLWGVLLTSSRVTIRDVAAKAGVSHQTVSRVINNSERVNDDTRARVQATIAEMGYRPNAIARFMARGRTYNLACFSPNLTDFTYANIIEAAETEARRLGYFLLISSAPDEKSFTTLVDQLLFSRRAEGLLVISPFLDARHERLPRNIPTVFVGAEPIQEEMSSVCLDEVSAGYTATQHLIGLGHRQIAHISGPVIEDCTRHRLTGYHEALKEVNLNFDPTLVVEGDWSATAGYHIVERWLHNGTQFSAIFAQNDRMAVGSIRAIRDAGKRVPEDISVIGFDDMPLASYFEPPLTTIRQDTSHIGRGAVRLLIQAVEQAETPPQKLRLPAELIQRGSTARYTPDS